MDITIATGRGPTIAQAIIGIDLIPIVALLIAGLHAVTAGRETGGEIGCGRVGEAGPTSLDSEAICRAPVTVDGIAIITRLLRSLLPITTDGLACCLPSGILLAFEPRLDRQAVARAAVA